MEDCNFDSEKGAIALCSFELRATAPCRFSALLSQPVNRKTRPAAPQPAACRAATLSFRPVLRRRGSGG